LPDTESGKSVMVFRRVCAWTDLTWDCTL